MCKNLQFSGDLLMKSLTENFIFCALVILVKVPANGKPIKFENAVFTKPKHCKKTGMLNT